MLPVIFFLGVFLGGNILANYAFDRLIFSKKVNNQRDRQFEVYKADTRLLVLGDSHAMRAVNPEMIDNSFNYATSATTVVEWYYMMDKLLQDPQVQLDVVLVELDLHIFNSAIHRLAGMQDPSYWCKYIDYYDLGKSDGRVVPFLLHRARGEVVYLGGLGDTEELLQFKADGYQTELVKGFVPSDNQEKRNIQHWARSQARAQLYGEQAVDPLILDYMVRLLALCQAHGVQVVLVSFPVSTYYWQAAAEYVDAEVYFEQVFARLDSEGLQPLWLDYHDLLVERQSQLFRDPDHLAEQGANEFSTILADELQQRQLLP